MNIQEAFEYLKANYVPEEDRTDDEAVVLGFAHDPSGTNPPFLMIELLYEPQQHRINNEGYYADIKFSNLPETNEKTVRCFTCNTIDELLHCLPDCAANLNYQSYEPEEPAFDADFEDLIKETFSTLASCKLANLEKEAIKAINKLNNTK